MAIYFLLFLSVESKTGVRYINPGNRKCGKTMSTYTPPTKSVAKSAFVQGSHRRFPIVLQINNSTRMYNHPCHGTYQYIGVRLRFLSSGKITITVRLVYRQSDPLGDGRISYLQHGKYSYFFYIGIYCLPNVLTFQSPTTLG